MTCRCGSGAPNGFYVCTSCGESLAYALAEVDGVVEVLDAGVARTSLTAGYGERVSSSGPLHAPLPINEAVFDARRALHVYLMRAGLRLAETCGPLTSRSSQGIAAYLIRHLDTLRRQDWAHTVEPELRTHLRHGHDHVHLVVSRVSDTGEVWHARTDRRAAQSACTRLENEHGLVQAPRRREGPKQAVKAERAESRSKTRSLASHRAVKDAERRELEEQGLKIQKMREASFPNPPTTRGPAKGIVPVARPFTRRQPGRAEGHER